jgi:hypothetical protein
MSGSPGASSSAQARYERVLVLIGKLAIFNLLALWILSSAFGDAWYGIVKDGHYYLAKHATHVQPVEVSHFLFQLSLWHVKSQFVTVPLGILASLILKVVPSNNGLH